MYGGGRCRLLLLRITLSADPIGLTVVLHPEGLDTSRPEPLGRETIQLTGSVLGPTWTVRFRVDFSWKR